MKRSHLFAAAIVSVAALGGAAVFMIDGEGGLENAVAQEGIDESVLTPETIATLEERGYAIGEIPLGDPEAPVTIVEYARLDCPACRTFHERVLPAIKEQYIDTGVAKLVVREIYANPLGLTATAVARCGGPERYHGFLDALFRLQDDWGRSRTMDELRASVAQIARLGGLPVERIDQCLSDELYLDYLVAVAARGVEADNVSRTPTLFVNGELYTGQYTDVGALGAMIEAAAAETTDGDATQ